MIRKLSEQDRAKVLEYLSEEPSINLFIIGDIENFGFDESFQELWGDFEKNGEYKAVMLRYHESFIVYSKNSKFNVNGFKEIISSFEGNKIISCKNSLAGSFENLIPELTKKRYYFCELSSKDNLLNFSNVNIKTALPEDAARISELINEIDEFATEIPASRLAESIKNKSKRVYYIENEKREIISTAQTAAENSKSAMIVGVATKKGYRKRGLMSACMSKLCSDVLDERKTLCLFYDNPDAGKVYHKLGFEKIEDWLMYR